jgi:hypothetical protein
VILTRHAHNTIAVPNNRIEKEVMILSVSRSFSPSLNKITNSYKSMTVHIAISVMVFPAVTARVPTAVSKSVPAQVMGSFSDRTTDVQITAAVKAHREIEKNHETLSPTQDREKAAEFRKYQLGREIVCGNFKRQRKTLKNAPAAPPAAKSQEYLNPARDMRVITRGMAVMLRIPTVIKMNMAEMNCNRNTAQALVF